MEREVLKRWAGSKRASAVQAGALGLGLPLSLGGLFAVSSTVALVLAPLALLSPLLLVACGRAWIVHRRYTRELRADRILVFEGRLPAYATGAVDEHHRRLIASGRMNTEAGALQNLKVLPESREVLIGNDIPGRPGMRAEIVEVAEPPASAFRVPLPGGPPPATEGVEIKRRRLNRNELYELNVKAAQLRRLSAGFWILTVLAGLVLAAWIHDESPIPPRVPTQVIPPALWVFTMYELLRNRVRAHRLGKDIELGWVVTFDSVPGTAEQAAQAPITACESLVFSGLSWTVNGAPARWRGARWFCTLLIDRRA